MRIKIGIIGKAGRSRGLPETLVKSAKIIGKEITKRGCVLVTGSLRECLRLLPKLEQKKKGLF